MTRDSSTSHPAGETLAIPPGDAAKGKKRPLVLQSPELYYQAAIRRKDIRTILEKLSRL